MTVKIISYSRAKEVLQYNPETGIVIWIKRIANCIKIGEEAGNLDSTRGYRRIRIDGEIYYTHRLIWLLVHGYLPEHQIDHIDRNRANNRINNLRAVTNDENRKNLSLRKDNSSGYAGVYWREQEEKWYVEISVNGKTMYLGRFSDIQKASKARKEAEIKYCFHENHCKPII